jgi:hypothetical protein
MLNRPRTTHARRGGGLAPILLLLAAAAAGGGVALQLARGSRRKQGAAGG